ncbi:MAG: DUF503 domain-containing protein [Ruminiclostridium sp.]|nr:DUF503 domain-containing protein [Ruminiclostridium sp.]
MVVGILIITLYIGGMTSLKDKRSVIKSILAKIKAKYNVSAAETGRQDEWNKCEMGFSCVSNEASHADSMLSSVVDFIEADPRVEITNIYTETIHV